jgi:SUN domain-containing protein 1/2
VIGAPLGHFVNWISRTASTCIVFVFHLFGTLLGTIYNLGFRKPYEWATSPSSGSLPQLFLIGLLLSSLYLYREPLLAYLPSYSRTTPIYTAPDTPAADISELSARLQKIEAALSELSLDTEKGRTQVESSQRALTGRLGSLESKLQSESRRATDAEIQLRSATKDGLKVIRQEIETLQLQIHQQPLPQYPPVSGDTNASDEEARERLRLLEERVGTVEGGVKEALELGKKAVPSEPRTETPWWTKITPGSSSKSGLTIKTADGQDITKLLNEMVDNSVALYGKDNLARPDFALHSAGAMVIPSLTSDTLELRPKSILGKALGALTWTQYPIGRAPVVALHHDVHNGMCWPFEGSRGQLGISLVAPVVISDISVEHVAREVAFDMKSAPRDFEVWALVEGKDNLQKVKEWKAEKLRRRREAEERGETVEEEAPLPKTLPQSVEYIRIANFTYDIEAPKSIQTFPIDEDIRDLELDFGVIVFMVQNNWGHDYTCLYRVRVHGERLQQEVPSETNTNDASS